MYKIIQPKSFTATLATINNLGDVKSYQLIKGQSLLSDWPENVEIPISPVDPNLPDYGEKLTHFILAESSFVVVSDELKSMLSAIDNANLEFLPVKIVKRNGDYVDSDYYVLNVLNFSDIIDEEESNGSRNLLAPEKLSLVTKLVLDQSKANDDFPIFRTEQLPYLIFMKQKYIDQINSELPETLEILEEADYRS